MCSLHSILLFLTARGGENQCSRVLCVMLWHPPVSTRVFWSNQGIPSHLGATSSTLNPVRQTREEEASHGAVHFLPVGCLTPAGKTTIGNRLTWNWWVCLNRQVCLNLYPDKLLVVILTMDRSTLELLCNEEGDVQPYAVLMIDWETDYVGWTKICQHIPYNMGRLWIRW